MSSSRPASVTQRPFGQLPNGAPVTLFTLTNSHGLQAEILTYGGTMVRLRVPDRAGQFADIILGYRDLAGYLAGSAYFGALVGRVGNRIASGRFVLDGTSHQLATNDAPGGRPCHLHGGPGGFHKVLWQAEPLTEADAAGVRLTYHSPDGEEGYPGRLEVAVTYRLNDADHLDIAYQATTDRPTLVNLTQHNYYNLKGEDSGTILGHRLTLHASRFTPVDAGLIPTGTLAEVAGTPFDFRRSTPIGQRIAEASEQLRHGGGYDHNWVIDRGGPGLALAATVEEPDSGRRMEVWTEEPGIQFYSGNSIPSTGVGKAGQPHAAHQGFCLETQKFPDAPNHAQFPSMVVRPEAPYRTSTSYRFSTR